MLIGIAGFAGSGKSTVADILARHHGFVCVSLADILKRICKEVFDFSDEQLWGPSEKRNAPDKRYPHALTPRHALQQLGTEWGRHCYENVWIDHALRTAKLLLNPPSGWQIGYWPTRGLSEDPCDALTYERDRARGVVIPDVRFHNEVAAIHAAGGIIWKTQHGVGLQGAAGQHESERHIDSLEADAVVPRGPLSEVPAVVAKMLAALEEEPFELEDNRRLQRAGTLTRKP